MAHASLRRFRKIYHSRICNTGAPPFSLFATRVQEIMLRLALVSLAVVSSALLFGCSKPVGPSDIPGVYEATLPTGFETLELKPDGEYVQHFKGKQGVESTVGGKWEFEPYGGEPKVAMHNFSSHFPDSSPDKVYILLLGADRSWGRIRLYYSYNLDQYYSRKIA